MTNLKILFSPKICGLFIILIALFTLGAPDNHASAAKSCPKQSTKARVTVKVGYGKIHYKRGASIKQLDKIHFKGNNKPRGKMKTYTTGLTRATIYETQKISYKVLKVDRTNYCIYPDQLSVFIGYKDIEVFIAKRYRPGSCEYKNILKHENTHVKYHRNSLRKYDSRFKATLKKAFSKLKPIRTRSPKTTSSVYYKKMHNAINPIIKAANKEQDKNNSLLDSPANYKRENAKCKNWKL